MTNPKNKILKPGATIGILGGGQLGRMLSVAASRLGFKTCIFEPQGDCPASHVANYHFKSDYFDTEALTNFANTCDVITFEFENIPTTTLDIIEEITPIHPNRNALATSQDRFTEKNFLTRIGLQTAPYAAVNTCEDLEKAIDQIGMPAILKTRRMGYDGKGQSRLMSPDDAVQAMKDMAGAPAVLEGFIDFSIEISVIGTRSSGGAISCFDPGQNVHRNGILHTTTVPAKLNHSQRTDTVLLTANILNALDYVGTMGVEIFVTQSGLIVNEIAPRVHNSGHWTQEGCAIDQFEQHIRAIAGWPLGDGSRHSNIIMENLVGDDVNRIMDIAKTNTAIHLYSKASAKPGRKMGHINTITGSSV